LSRVTFLTGVNWHQRGRHRPGSGDVRLKENPLDYNTDNTLHKMYINVEPRLKPEEAGYPFALNADGALLFSRGAADILCQVGGTIKALTYTSVKDKLVNWRGIGLQMLDRP
jgi:hypothetical protein